MKKLAVKMSTNSERAACVAASNVNRVGAIILALVTVLHVLRADASAYRVSVLADTDRTEGGELAGLIVNDLRRSQDVIIDDKLPDLTISCFAIHSDSNDAHATRIAASVAIMSGHNTLMQHFALTADSFQSLAQKVVAEFNKRELDFFRRADRPEK